MRKKRAIILLTLTTICTATLAVLYYLGFAPLLRGEMTAHDALVKAGRFTPCNDKLLFLAIDSDSISVDATDVTELFQINDEQTIEAKSLGLMSAHWPWPRSIYSLILDRLIGAGAKVVVFDLNFPTPGPAEQDAAFRAALDRYGDRVVIGSNFISALQRNSTIASSSHTPPSESLIDSGTTQDRRVGFVNFWPDFDGVIREAQFTISFGAFTGDPDDSQPSLSLAARAVNQLGRGELVPHDQLPRGLRFSGRPNVGFPAHSIFEIFVPEYWARNYGSGAAFKNAIVVVGAAGNWQHDEHQTPFGLMPGPELQLNAINALLHQDFIKPLPMRETLLSIALSGLVSLLVWRLCSSPFPRLACVVLLLLLWGGVALELYNRFGLIIPIAAPMIAIVLNVLIGFGIDLFGERVERSRLRKTLERYVSKNVVEELIDRPGSFLGSLGGTSRPATILFSDIRDYSGMSVNTEPHALVEQLNEYLTAMVECVFRHNGTLDKFIGDAVMAVWGNATTDGSREDALQATRAAFAMREELGRLNAKWRAEGRTEFNVGIALNHGDVIVGNIGSPQRMEFTVIGDAVNATWRLQERTKLHDCELLVGESLAQLIAPEFMTQPLGKVQISRTTSANYCRVLARQSFAAAERAEDVPQRFAEHAHPGSGVLQPA